MADAEVNTRLLDTIDLTGDEPVITTKVIKEIFIDLDDDTDEGEEDDENTVPVKRVKVVNKKCEICLEEISKYTCPRCSMKSCSLDCVLEHKRLTGCSGQRNKTSFISRTEFNNIHLLNDYTLLEEVARIAENAKRDYKSKKPWMQKKVEILHTYAKKAGVLLYSMEKGMKRQKENMSRYIFQEESIQWTVKLVFVDIEKEFKELYFDREVMENILEKYINKDKVLAENKITFAPYIQRESTEEVSLFFRNEFDPGDNWRYTLVDHKKTLKECLDNKSVLEYPEFHVVLPQTVKQMVTEEFVKDKVVNFAPPCVVPLDNWLAS